MHYPLYRQLDSRDCGPTCLRMVARFYGRKLSPDYARSLCGTGRSGSTLLALSEAAEAIRSAPLDTMSPIEAMNLLYELKRKLEG